MIAGKPMAVGSRWALLAALGLLAALMAPFARHAATFGIGGLTGDLAEPTHLADGAGVAGVVVFAHMLTGAAVTLLAPLQLAPFVRRRFPRVHRACGYALIVAALATAAGGLGYIALRGAVGGPLMSVGFAGYGVCLAVAAVMTLRRARAGDRAGHRDWALRLFALAIGSFLYRLHYALWHVATGGAGSEPDFSGAFDRIQNFAFYLPYLAALEIAFRLRDRARAAR